MLIMIAFILIVLSEGIQAELPYWEFVVSGGIIWVWMLGSRYERQVIVDAGLADPDDVKAAEQDASTWLNWS